MAKRWATRPFGEEVRALLEERDMSIRELGRRVRVDDSHLVRVLQGRKEPTLDLIRRVRSTLKLSVGYFAEEREAALLERIRRSGRLRDRLYGELIERDRGRSK